MIQKIILLMSCALIFGCATNTHTDNSTPEANFSSILASAERGAEDLERDQTSKPAEVLAFYGVKPGMRIADLFSGGGYYSEILSLAVGANGRITAHNNGPYSKFAGDAPSERYANNRLSNLEYIVTEADDLQLPNDLDMIFMVMSFHDTYWINEKQGWPKMDNPRFNTQVFNSLKSGGSLAIVDHSARAGSGTDDVGGLHRIEEAFVIAELEAVGFRLVEKSGLLRTSADDRSKLVFDPEIRRKTDRFMLRFEKP